MAEAQHQHQQPEQKIHGQHQQQQPEQKTQSGCDSAFPLHASGKAAVGPEAPTAFTPTLKRAHETDLLVYDVYAKGGVSLDALAQQIEVVRVPHVKIAAVEKLENSPAEGVNRMRVTCVLKDSTEQSVLLVEESLLHLQHGNHGAVSSVAFRGYTKSF